MSISTKEQQKMEQTLREIIEEVKRAHPDAIGTQLIPDLVECSYEHKSAEFKITILPSMSNPKGMTHGGVIATIFDNATGILANSLVEDGWCPTINLQITYIKPVHLNSVLHVIVRVQSAGRSLINLYAEAFDEENRQRLLATATGQFFTIR